MNQKDGDTKAAVQLSLRPQRMAFVARRLWSTLVGLLVFSAAALAASMMVDPRLAWLIGLFVVIAAFGVVDALVAFQKQRYVFGPRAIDYGDGHLLTNRDTNLSYANVTHVRLIKPFIEYRLFGTGRIIIESAGSKDATVELKSIKQPEQAFQDIRQLLAKNSFSLTYANLLSKQKPSPLAVILQLIGTVFAGASFLFLTVGVGTIAALATDFPSWLVGLAALLLAGGGVAYLYAVWQDQLRRTYYVYNDVIHYSKGFLTHQEAFMPAANLANTRLTQNFVGKLLGLKDVIISCQGQGSQINFSNLRDGDDMQDAINRLINHVDRVKIKTQAADNQPADATSATRLDEIVDKFTNQPTPRGQAVEAQDFSMQTNRALLAYAPLFPLLILVFPLLIALLVWQYITVKRTVYRLSPGGVASYYSFLSTSNVEFSRDKITGLVIRRNPLDRWLGTCTATFWSIGSGQSINFQYIRYDEQVRETLCRQAGIVDDEELELIRPQFGWKQMVQANLPEVVADIIAAVVIIVLAWLFSWWLSLLFVLDFIFVGVYYLVAKRRYDRAWLRLGQHTISANIGIMFNLSTYVRTDNVKDITLTKYPTTDLGVIRFNVAGEQTGSDSNGGVVQTPNSFGLAFLPDVGREVSGQTYWLDNLLQSKPTKADYRRDVPAPKIGQQVHPDLRNSLVPLTLLHVVIFPLLLVLPLSLGLRAFWLRRVGYIVDGQRTIRRWGVIYRRQTSILHSRLDYTETGQNAGNKIFKNGNIYLYTAGSSNVELVLSNLSSYRDFHRAIQARDDR